MPILTFPKSTLGGVIDVTLRPSFARSFGSSTPIVVYDLNIRLSGKSGQAPWEIEPLLVDARAKAFASEPYDGLVGRDVLDRAMLIYNGHMHECTLAY